MDGKKLILLQYLFVCFVKSPQFTLYIYDYICQLSWDSADFINHVITHLYYSQCSYLNNQLNSASSGDGMGMQWMSWTNWATMGLLRCRRHMQSEHSSVPEISPKFEQLESKPARTISSYESLFYPNQQHMLTVENGMLYLPTALPCAFIFGITVTKTTALMCFPHNSTGVSLASRSSFPPQASRPCWWSTQHVYLLSGYIRFCVRLPLLPCFLSPSRWQSDFTDTRSHPPTLQDNCRLK